MIPFYQNSFYTQRYTDLSILVIVPHQDDEINTAGALIYTLSQCGAKISLVYTTNGDWKFSAETRFQEAVSSAGVLGVTKEHIFFLGYGDAISNNKKDHIFYAKEKATTSASGHSETYGVDDYPDYIYARTGQHHAYTRDNYLEDLASIIREVKANLIICTDFDEHPDHRMLSLCFDEAMGIVRKLEPGYCPEVWKRFAYTLAYTAIKDYSPFNNPETKRPVVGVTGKYGWDMVDTSIYEWEKRIRIPVPTMTSDLCLHPLVNALCKHQSQFIVTHADSIINSDEVYWGRRTDGISYAATISVSSGNGDYLNDFMLYNVEDIDSPIPPYENYYWHPDKDDNEKKAILHWNIPQHIEKIVVYGIIGKKSGIKKLKISLSDGYVAICEKICPGGLPTMIELGGHDNITECEISLIEIEGDDYGLSECEVYCSSESCSCINPFYKILIDDNFAYEYVCDIGTECLNVGLYAYGVKSIDKIEVIKGKSEIIGTKLILNPSDKEVCLRIENKEMMIWDQVVVRRLTSKEMETEHKKSKKDKAYLNGKRKMQKISNMLYLLKHEGIKSVMMRTVVNHILPYITKR